MQEAKSVAYLRVSTARQGQSGVGLQREAVARYLRGGAKTPCRAFIEVEDHLPIEQPTKLVSVSIFGRCSAALDLLSRQAHHP